jgi:heptaprenyl diphosphate synthase
MEHQKTKQMVLLSMMMAIAIILHYIESLFPLPVAIPGIKLGLSNVVSLVALYLFGPGSAILIMVLRVLMTSFLYSGLSSAIFSLFGGILAVSAMILIWTLRNKGFSIVGASVAGGIFHNAGQLMAASIVLGTSAVFSFFPYLIVSGIVTGTATGLLSNMIVPRLKTIIT